MRPTLYTRKGCRIVVMAAACIANLRTLSTSSSLSSDCFPLSFWTHYGQKGAEAASTVACLKVSGIVQLGKCLKVYSAKGTRISNLERGLSLCFSKRGGIDSPVEGTQIYGGFKSRQFGGQFFSSRSCEGERETVCGVLPTAASESMAGNSSNADLGKGESAIRPEMLSKAPYSPPSWASKLHPAPSHYYSLGQFPTPIHRWHIPGLPTGTEVWIKRDDLTGMQLSGNKVRKLEFILADAKKQGADCVITIGGIQSNHCRATAVAAKYLNLDCHLILRTSRTIVEEDPGLTGNLLVERLVGAHVHLVSKEEYVQLGSVALGDLLSEKLKAEGRKPYVVPVGGSNSLGTWGYIEFVRELEGQMQAGKVSNISHFDDIVMACGSGGTTAGLGLAAHLSSLNTKVHAYAVCDDSDYFYDYTQGLMDGLNAGVSSRDIIRIVTAKGLGYAMSTSEELKLVKDIAESTGVILDPVYSGKAVNGMLKDMAKNPSEWEGKKVLFVHTGGLLGMYDKVLQLQPLLGKWERFDLAESTVQQGAGTGKMF